MRILKSLFAKPPNAAGPLYDRLVAEARRPDWYRAGGISDTIDGRFAVLATLVARALVALEEDGEEGVRDSAALTERFVADMDAQMRQSGFDTTLGKKVRKLVAAMAMRHEAWRGDEAETHDRVAAVAGVALSVDGAAPDTGAVELLRAVDSRIGAASRAGLMAGSF